METEKEAAKPQLTMTTSGASISMDMPGPWPVREPNADKLAIDAPAETPVPTPSAVGEEEMELYKKIFECNQKTEDLRKELFLLMILRQRTRLGLLEISQSQTQLSMKIHHCTCQILLLKQESEKASADLERLLQQKIQLGSS